MKGIVRHLRDVSIEVCIPQFPVQYKYSTCVTSMSYQVLLEYCSIEEIGMIQ
jgi:hypothetical protein